MVDVDIDAEAAEMYFSARFAPGGYAWIIPLGEDAANVGVGVRASYLGKVKLARSSGQVRQRASCRRERS